MTDSKGPYRVEHLKRNNVLSDRWRVHGPGVNNTYSDDEEAAEIADDLNLAHHTARREAIEECITALEDRRKRTRDGDYHAAITVAINDVRALLGAGEKEA